MYEAGRNNSKKGSSYYTKKQILSRNNFLWFSIKLLHIQQNSFLHWTYTNITKEDRRWSVGRIEVIVTFHFSNIQEIILFNNTFKHQVKRDADLGTSSMKGREMLVCRGSWKSDMDGYYVLERKNQISAFRVGYLMNKTQGIVTVQWVSQAKPYVDILLSNTVLEKSNAITELCTEKNVGLPFYFNLWWVFLLLQPSIEISFCLWIPLSPWLKHFVDRNKSTSERPFCNYF